MEVGYSLLEAFQKRGFATEAMRALIDRAFSMPDVNMVIAQTLPELTPSIRVLERLGFRFAGLGAEEGAIRYELPRQGVAATPAPVERC